MIIYFPLLCSILTSVDDKLTLKHSLRCLQRACLMHENNRQMIVEADLLTILKPFLRCDECFFLKEVCCLFRFLVLDDDIRVEFGKAHDHARLIAGEVLEEITLLLNSRRNWFMQLNTPAFQLSLLFRVQEGTGTNRRVNADHCLADCPQRTLPCRRDCGRPSIHNGADGEWIPVLI